MLIDSDAAPPALIHRLNALTANQLVALGAVCAGLGTLRRMADRGRDFDTGELWRFCHALERVLTAGRSPESTIAAARLILEEAVPDIGHRRRFR